MQKLIKYSLNIAKPEFILNPLSFIPVFILYLLSFILFISCGKETPPAPPETQINLAHLDHLYGETVMNGDTVGFIVIYAEAPDYEWVVAPGEGLACVDDVARAAVVYLNDAQQNGTPASEQKLRRLLKFLIHMQAPNGLFYNFIFDDHSINTTRENSQPLPNWWAWRSLWALAEAYPFYQKNDPDFAKTLDETIQKMMPEIDALLENYPQIEMANGFPKPQWIPYGAADQSSVLLLGLTAYHRTTGDAQIAEKMRKIGEGIIKMQLNHEGFFADGALLSWENVWHAWGNSQAHALINAGMALQDAAMIDAGVKEVRLFQPYLLAQNFIREIRFTRNGDDISAEKTVKFEQIAYDIRPMVMAALAAHQATGEQQYTDQAAQLMQWFFGKNPAGAVIYDAATGRGYDGINDAKTVNRNSGAESTIESLLALQALKQH
ncbi:MAG: glycoside hydrolase family 9 protein [Calditrichaeota bacterium]|nr:glycoside hydrolase family 9 protein [Calditrichota bacterium]MCB0268663.1 glycoside hydrolase family 9 protein [Calditrichota bacterium]